MQLINSKTRSAYTLLELMIALGLLGALMSVAWSLMATFRDSEERGWKITRRTQIIRAAHAWLQSDAQQMLGNSSESTFVGNSLGFSATIAPSLDPLPFLERLLSDASASDELDSRNSSARGGPGPGGSPSTDAQSPGALSTLDEELNANFSGASPWSSQLLQIEYELAPVSNKRSDSSADANRPTENRELDEIQFMLVRRELFDGAKSSSERSALRGNSSDFSQEISPSDRVLTGQDLYRQNDDQRQSRGVPVAQSRLEGLVQPQFQYCDGRTWKDNWNSRTDRGLPAAIALRFDFPARAQMQPPRPYRASDASEADAGGLSAADMALAGESQAELETDAEASLMESDQFEVQMVVMVAGGSAHTARPVDSLNSLAPFDSTGSSELATPQGPSDLGARGLEGGF